MDRALDSLAQIDAGTELSEGSRPGRVLVVDDDAGVRRTIERILAPEWEAVLATDGQSGLEAFQGQDFDVLITDISMPGMDGLAFSERVREMSDDVPVILITGSPSVESAMEAVTLRAFRYLPKPFRPSTLKETVEHAAKQGRMARIRREAVEIAGHRNQKQRALRHAEVEEALGTLWMAYQPIVDRGSRVIGYEALLRYDKGPFEDPVALLTAAEELGRGEQLCERTLYLAAASANAHSRALLFLNVDPRRLRSFTSAQDPLREMASRIVLEITEHLPLRGIPEAQAAIADLKEVGYRLAVDDLGSGYSGINSFASIGPEFVKLDRALVNGVAVDPSKRRIIKGMNRLCHDLGIRVIAEGIERSEDFETVKQLGCDLFQGFLIGRPGPLGS
jgi:EAL domain-containing protein (putative c-di-GMP-specific phosphodiesterase class I)/CheY-like chemotaxis protein